MPNDQPGRWTSNDDNVQSEVSLWLTDATSGEGLTLANVTASRLFGICWFPNIWPRPIRIARLFALICDVARQGYDGRNRIVILTALNQFAGVYGPTLESRLESLSRQGDVGQLPATTETKTKLVAQWHDLRPTLAEKIVAEVRRRSLEGWAGYATDVPVVGEPELQPFVVSRLEVTYHVDSRRVCTEATTQRWISADLSDVTGVDHIDHYKVRAKYSLAGNADGRVDTKISALLNCAEGPTTVSEEGLHTTSMLFPRALRQGDELFFASRVDHLTSTPMDPLVFIEVTSLGLIELIMRVQFSPGAAPSSCWAYGGRDDPNEGVVPVPEDRDRILTPTQLGYVEYTAKNCPPGWFFAIGWEWPDQ